MKEEDYNNQPDDAARAAFGQLAEQAPSDRQWQQMKAKMAGEGLITEKSRRPGLIILFSLLMVGTLSTGIYFFNHTQPSHSQESGSNRSSSTSATVPATPGSPKAASPLTSTTDDRKTEKTIAKNSEPVTEGSHAENKSTLPAAMPGKNTVAESKSKAMVAEKKTVATTTNSQKQAAKDGSKATVNNGVASNARHKSAPVVSAALIAEKKSSVVVNKQEKTAVQNAETEQASNKATEEKSNSSTAQNEQQQQPSTVAPSDAEAKKTESQADNYWDPKQATKKDSASGESQEPSSPASCKTTKTRWHLGAYWSFDFTNYLVKENSSVLQSDVDYVLKSYAIEGVNSTFQFTTGLTGGYMITDKIEFEAGVFYSQKKKVSDNLTAPTYKLDSVHEAYSDFTYNYTAKYLEVNGRFKYYIPSADAIHKFYFGLGAVASFNFPESKGSLGYYSRTSYTDSVWEKYDKVILEPKSATISGLIAVGFETTLYDRWGVFLEPSYKYAFNPVIKHPTYDYIPVNHYWRTISIGFGLRYGF